MKIVGCEPGPTGFFFLPWNSGQEKKRVTQILGILGVEILEILKHSATFFFFKNTIWICLPLFLLAFACFLLALAGFSLLFHSFSLFFQGCSFSLLFIAFCLLLLFIACPSFFFCNNRRSHSVAKMSTTLTKIDIQAVQVDADNNKSSLIFPSGDSLIHPVGMFALFNEVSGNSSKKLQKQIITNPKKNLNKKEHPKQFCTLVIFSVCSTRHFFLSGVSREKKTVFFPSRLVSRVLRKHRQRQGERKVIRWRGSLEVMKSWVFE